MRLLFILLLASLPFVGACQWLPTGLFHSEAHQTKPAERRLQGELLRQANQLWFKECGNHTPRFLRLEASARTFFESVRTSGFDEGALFADVAVTAPTTPEAPLQAQHFYRIAKQSICATPEWPKLIAQAGNAPAGWSIKVMTQGLLLERAGQPTVALPYVEEQLPDGLVEFSSAANGQRIRLSISPELCINPSLGWYPLRARLYINDDTVRMSCANFGGASHRDTRR